MTDWGGKVATWFTGVSGVSAALATLVWVTARQPLNVWASVLFFGLVAIGAMSFLALLLTGLPAAWSAARNRVHLTAITALAPAGKPAAGSGSGDLPGALPQEPAGQVTDLSSELEQVLREAAATFAEFIATGAAGGGFESRNSHTVLRLSLGELERRLGTLSRITVTTSPSAVWATELSAAARRAGGAVRSFRDLDREPRELIGSVQELLDLILGRYPALAGGRRSGKNLSSTPESS